MKTSKKIASLFLAMLMALSCMAMTASAVEESVVQPRIPAMQCGYCGVGMTEVYRDHDDKGYFSIVECRNRSCTNYGHQMTLRW